MTSEGPPKKRFEGFPNDMSLAEMEFAKQVLEKRIEEKKAELAGPTEVEGAPRIRAVRVGESIPVNKVSETFPQGAGQAEWEWILSHQEEAQKMLPASTGWYVFPGKEDVRDMLAWTPQGFTPIRYTRLTLSEEDFILLID